MLCRRLTRATITCCPGVSVVPMMQGHRGINMGDPSQLFTSPGGLMALLYNRTGPLAAGAGKAADSAHSTKNKEGAPQSRPGRSRRYGRPVVRARQGGSAEHDGEASPSATCSPAEGENGNASGDSGQGGGSYSRSSWRERLRAFWVTLIGSEALWLAVLVFSFSALWELLKSQKGVAGEKFKNMAFTTLEVRSSQLEYAMIMDWMSCQARERRTGNLALKPITIADEKRSRMELLNDESDVKQALLVPGYGVHLFNYNGVRLWIAREADSTKQHGNFAQKLDRENDVLTITFLTRNRSVVDEFLTTVSASWKENLQNVVRVMTCKYGNWLVATERARRPMETLYLPHSTKQLVEEMKAFYKLRETYSQLGIPWRRGYLFEGPPGTGKSSLIMAIAGELGLPLCTLSLRNTRMDDDDLLENIASLPPRCLLLLEDFENSLIKPAASGATSNTSENGDGGSGGISLSGLLNALDGVASTEGRLLIITSNDASLIPLPEALLRPGRIDRRVRFDKLTDEQLREMQKSFEQVLFDSPNPVLNRAATMIQATMASHHPGEGGEGGEANPSPAAFQEALLENVYAAYAEMHKKTHTAAMADVTHTA